MPRPLEHRKLYEITGVEIVVYRSREQAGVRLRLDNRHFALAEVIATEENFAKWQARIGTYIWATRRAFMLPNHNAWTWVYKIQENPNAPST